MSKPGSSNKKGKCALVVLQTLEREVIRQLVSASMGDKVASDTVANMALMSGDGPDQAAKIIDIATNDAINRPRMLRLRQIKGAIERYQAGKYGICITCEESIDPRRLRAHPEAGECVSCLEKKEHRASMHQHHGSRILAN